MILLINICKENLHFNEFVKPVGDVLKNNDIKYKTKHYLDVKTSDINKAEKIIICGTSLADNEFLKKENLKKFSWIKESKKPVLGICGGSHIIGLVLGYKKKRNLEIGMKRIKLKKNFLGITGEINSYFLHQFKVLPKVYHKDNIYATLFHPEVRNNEIILNFAKL